MPSKQRHRGQHPSDAQLFAARQIPVLRAAVADLSYLLTRNYAEKAALKLVGDHYQLAKRQRQAVLGAACGDETLRNRRRTGRELTAIAGQSLWIDGYNVLITVESALSGGLLFRGRDGCYRDLASVHGSYKRVEETTPAIRCIGALLEEAAPAEVTWLFDAPVSNSGRLKTLILEEAASAGWPWDVRLEKRVDAQLAEAPGVIATADGNLLDRAKAWVNLTAPLLARLDPTPAVVELDQPGAAGVRRSVAG